MHRIRRTAALLLALTVMLLCPVAAAQDTDDAAQELAGKTLEGLMAQFMDERNLNETNFSICYYNTVTGEEYCFNETHFMVAASTYKLPLNLYYYELEAAGEITADTYIPDAGTTLENCHRLSLVDSNNEVSIALLYQIGSFHAYKDAMRTYFTMPDDELDPEYYSGNYYCTQMMMDCLKYLYDHAEEFPQMLDYMTQACPGAYFRTYLDDVVTVAHKYGSFEGAENDTGIIYASQPFLLAVYTQSVGAQVCADVAELLYRYTEYRYEVSEQERIANEQKLAEQQAAEEQAQKVAQEQELKQQQLAAQQAERLAAEQAQQAAEAAQAQQPLQQTPVEASTETPPDHQSAFEWWMIAVALGVFGIGSGITALILHASTSYRGKHTTKTK